MQAAHMEPDTCVDSISTTSGGMTFVSDLLISDSSDCRLYSDFLQLLHKLKAVKV